MKKGQIIKLIITLITFLNIIKSVKNILANMKIEKRVKKLEQELDEKK